VRFLIQRDRLINDDRLGFNKIENRILGMNDPDHKETVFLETIQEVKGFMGGEV
jgi:hypothetical protein